MKLLDNQMKKIRTAFLSLCTATLLLSAVPSFAEKETLSLRIRERNPYEKKIERIINHPDAQQVSYGLYDVKLDLHRDKGEYVTLAFFLRSNNAEFVILDVKGNEYGDVDVVYKKKDNGYLRIDLGWIETMKFNGVYHKIIDKSYSKTDKKKPSGDWIKLLERTLKEYYREKEDMEKLEAILEKK